MSVLDWNVQLLSWILIPPWRRLRALCRRHLHYLSHERGAYNLLRQIRLLPNQFKASAEIKGRLKRNNGTPISDQLQAGCHRHQSTYRCFFLHSMVLTCEAVVLTLKVASCTMKASSLAILVVDFAVCTDIVML